MIASLRLDKMTVSDKIRALEDIWDDLRRTPERIPVPAWHADVLRARERRVRGGQSRFKNWSNAKRRIRERVR